MNEGIQLGHILVMSSSSTPSSTFDTPILSIQELAKQPIVSLPRIFLMEDHERSVPLENPSVPDIPTIDMKRLIMSETADFELDKLHSACKEWGFFQLVNHGVSSSLVQNLKHEIIEFYKFPLEEKMKYKIPGDVEGYGPTIIRSEDQKLDWGDRFYAITNPIHKRKPYLLPQLPSSLRDNLELYISESQKMAMRLLGLMAKAINLDQREFQELFDDGRQAMRMSYYPPCPEPEMVMGIAPHSDATGITILLQVNEVNGLQIKKDGVWIPVNVLPDALVVNVGDILEMVTNGMYRSVEHRAAVNRTKERISIAMFFCPKYSAEVGPSVSLITPQYPPLFKRIGMEKYYNDFFSRKLDGKSYLEQMKIKN